MNGESHRQEQKQVGNGEESDRLRLDQPTNQTGPDWDELRADAEWDAHWAQCDIDIEQAREGSPGSGTAHMGYWLY